MARVPVSRHDGRLEREHFGRRWDGAAMGAVGAEPLDVLCVPVHHRHQFDLDRESGHFHGGNRLRRSGRQQP